VSAAVQLLLGAGGAALLMGAWALVQQHWLRRFAPRQVDALAARRAGFSQTDTTCDRGCAACGDHHCTDNGGR
jgi:hypothetical protein